MFFNLLPTVRGLLAGWGLVSQMYPLKTKLPNTKPTLF